MRLFLKMNEYSNSGMTCSSQRLEREPSLQHIRKGGLSEHHHSVKNFEDTINQRAKWSNVAHQFAFIMD
jgi:hypothetical protein